MNRTAFSDLRALLVRVRETPATTALGKRVRFDLTRVIANAEPGDCGTAACAIGHMILDPVLSKKYAIEPSFFYPGMHIRHHGFDQHWTEAAITIFGVDYKTASALFNRHDERHNDVDDMIERIDTFVQHGDFAP
jgi:hypothetical protein